MSQADPTNREFAKRSQIKNSSRSHNLSARDVDCPRAPRGDGVPACHTSCGGHTSVSRRGKPRLDPHLTEGQIIFQTGLAPALPRQEDFPEERNAQENLDRSLCRANRNHRYGVGADLSDQAGDHDHSVRGGRPDRRARPRHGAAHERDPRPAGGGRERRRRRRHDRLQARRRRGARRLHDRARHRRHPGAEPDDVQEAALQFARPISRRLR